MAKPTTDPGMARAVNLRREAYDVYIGRPGKGQPGPWGNPFPLQAGQPRGDTLGKYNGWLQHQIAAGQIAPEALAALHGKKLGCFCKPQACHGDLLAQAAARAFYQLHPELRPERPQSGRLDGGRQKPREEIRA